MVLQRRLQRQIKTGHQNCGVSMQNIDLCEFVEKYGLWYDEGGTFPTEIYIIDDCIGELNNSDSLFNTYGMMYAMRELLFLFTPHDIHKMAEYMFDFALNNPHAQRYNILHPNSPVPKTNTTWSNPYYKDSAFVVSESKTIEFYRKVLQRGIIERCFYNHSSLCDELEAVSLEVFGNPFMSNPVMESIEKASSIREKMDLGNISILNEFKINSEIMDKHNMLHDIVCGNSQEGDSSKYKLLVRNLMCIFNIDEFIEQRDRLKSIIVMKPLSSGFELIFPSWDDFTNWLNINKEDIHAVIQAYTAMNVNGVSNISLVSSLTPRQTSLFTSLKFLLGDYKNNPVCAGMTHDEINKNYNRQKIYNNVESLLRVVSGAKT